MKYDIKYGYMRYGVLLAVCVYDTVENGRTAFTEKTLYGFLDTVNFNRHTLFISDNGSYKATQNLYIKFIADFGAKFPENRLIICLNGENLGTARGINKAIQIRERGQKVIKADNDIYVHGAGWVEQMEEALERDHLIGALALKRTQIDQHAWSPDPQYRTTPRELPHIRDQRHIIVEDTQEILGTLIMMSDRLLDRIGSLVQCENSPYGYDDSLLSLRTNLAGFKTAYLPHILIDHLDNGAGKYVQEKIQHVTDISEQFNEMVQDYRTGVRDVFSSPFD